VVAAQGPAVVKDQRQLDWCAEHCRATALAAFRCEVVATAELAVRRLEVVGDQAVAAPATEHPKGEPAG
jgi:hypothetical protein